nr:unnamed protein product [Callosobruchus chinensis]
MKKHLQPKTQKRLSSVSWSYQISLVQTWIQKYSPFVLDFVNLELIQSC